MAGGSLKGSIKNSTRNKIKGSFNTKSRKPQTVDKYWGSKLKTFDEKKRNIRDCVFYNMDTKIAIKCQYNPTNLPRSRSVNYATITSPGMAYPLIYFVSGEAEDLDIELLFHNMDSSKQLDNFENFLNSLLPPKHNNKGFKKPPTFKFYYGHYTETFVLVKKSITEEYLKENGKPYMRRYILSVRRV